MFPPRPGFGNYPGCGCMSKFQGQCRIIVCLVFLGISACTTQKPIEQEILVESWQIHKDKLSDLKEWKINGRIAVSIDKEAWSASLHWMQTGQDYLLRVIAPFGRGTFELHGNGEGVYLRLSRDRILQAEDPESLLEDNLGWSVPVSGMVYWVKGIPEPGMVINRLILDDKGRVTDLSQSGWQISYSRYVSLGDYELPRRIVIDNGNLRIRLVIREWNT